ncbi:hypothetical protein GHT06_007663 [Daphnia sinensis]|uniref:DUF5641 domain-containing protein n=1 Tax=Daphnia sinensis TaxID=1820382 RepID=A0AAD5PLQ3_9CRUS|nr:hypothetical protein GHT06_007663 [Daphnia sinensis]
MVERDPEDVPVDSARKRMPSAEEIHTRKKRRTFLRQQITTACKQIIATVNDRGLRGALKGLMAHLKHIHHEIVDTQEETHCTYMKAIGEAFEKAELYLCSRKEEADSVAPIDIPDECFRRRAEGLETAKKRVDEARAEAEEAERVLNALILQDEDHHSSVSHQRLVQPTDAGMGARDPSRKTGLAIPPGIMTPPLLDGSSAPDEWIDHYSRGSLPPVISSRSSRSSVSVDLESPAEKLAVLKRYIRGDCLDAIHALVRLKQSCGRRDAMRSAHIQAINQLDFKQDPTSFKRYAERIRTHFFDLTRIGETAAADLIERVLSDFGSWLCHRATAYQNAHSIAADQTTRFPKNNADARSDVPRPGRQRVNLGMIRLEIRSGDGRSSSMVNILVDEGSDSTRMTSSFARRLGLQGKAQILEVDGVGGEITRHKSNRVKFILITGSEEQLEIEASTMKKVANPAPVVDWKKKKIDWPHISDLPVGEVGGNIDLLIGLDYAHLLVVSESRGEEAGQPIASHTKFGWIIRVVTGPESTQNPVRSFRAVELRRFCDTEEFGSEFQSGCVSPDNKRALDFVTKNTLKLDVGYQVPITWRVNEPDLINNQEMATNRWRSLLRRFDRDPDFEKDYRAAMAKTFEHGYASVLQDQSDAKYFLAHHVVYKGPKLRVVFDAAATFRGKCLNDSIIAGPALQPSRFRLSEDDANYFCFLWGKEKATCPEICRMDRLPFGASCSPFVAIYTLRRIMEDAGASDPIISAVRESTYVDNYLNSASSVDAAVADAPFVRNCLLNADLKLQRWVSNSSEFIRKLTGGDRPSPTPPAHSLSPDLEEKVLGIIEDLRRLQKKKSLYSTSSILALAPILSEDGLLRLGGRAGRAKLPYDQLHPPLISGPRVGQKGALDCVVCRRSRAQPCEQMMADLTESRLDFGTLPFTRTAVDLFGPLEIGLYRNRTAIRWGVLYTCLITRAIFLDLVPSLSSMDFLLSLRRFIAMFPPTDDTFWWCARVLGEIYQTGALQRLGPRERELPSSDRRPPPDAATRRIFAPNDFLNRAPTAHPPAAVFDDAPPRDQYKYLQRTLNLFWDLWKTVYLQSLASRKKWKTPRPNLAVGDIVLEINNGLGRGIWKIGHVVRVFPGPDGCVRAVEVQLPAGIFRREITELCLLETGSSIPSSGEDVSAKSA